VVNRKRCGDRIAYLDEPGRALLSRSERVHHRKELASTRELAAAITGFLAARNQNPRRYVWKVKGEDILRKINTARQALAAATPDSNTISETSL
jgi:hypothetical protein